MDFFDQYFVKPVFSGEGYNVYNTTVYAVLLVVSAYIIYKLLTKMNVKIDRKFFVGIMPFLALGGTLRALEDFFEYNGAAKNVFLITPLIYVTMFVVALAALFVSMGVSRVIKRRDNYWKIWLALGIAAEFIALSMMSFKNYEALALMAGIFAAWVIAFVIIKLIAAKKFERLDAFLSGENMLVLLIHLFDATTTFVAISYYPYFEQHVLTGFLISVFGPASMFVTKIVVVSLVLGVFDKELAKEQQKRTFLKIVVAILGLGPGLRNFLRLVMGV